MSCRASKVCIADINKLCWELGYSVNRAEKIDGIIFAFVITMSDGVKMPFRYGKELIKFLREQKMKAKIVVKGI